MEIHGKVCAILAAGIFLALTLPGLAQTKRAAEECSTDAECESGNCVQLKKESKKVCLYCRQSDYDGYWSAVEAKCKGLDEIGLVRDVEAELQRSPNRRGEVSLPWLYNRRDLNADCLTARSTRENTCWKEGMNEGHEAKIDDLKELLGMTNRLIDESIRNGKAYKVDRATFDDLEEDEQDNCEDLRQDFDWLGSLEDDEQADCTQIASVADSAADCREVRRSIVDVFQDRASSERTEALKEAEAVESEAKRILSLKKDRSLCK